MAHEHEVDVPEVVKKRLVVTAVALAVLTVVGIVVLRPTGDDRPDIRRLGFVSDLYGADVVAVEDAACPGTRPEDFLVCSFVTIELKGGPHQGEERTLEIPIDTTSPDFDEGDEIVVSRTPGAGEQEYQFADRERRPVLLGLALLFGVTVVLLGRIRGLAALGGLVVSVVVLLQFTLPAIIDGRSPVLVAIVSAAAIAFLALYLAHGFNTMTTVALLGTLASLALTAVLAAMFVAVSEFSGFATEEALYLQVAGGRLDLEGLILAGAVIGALGAIDDMTVTQASAVWELRAVNPSMTRRALYTSGLRIGRDHVASTVNTLLLAYAGAALPLLLLFVLSEQSLGAVANGEAVAVEIVRTLVGSIGLVSSVPITTWLAVRLAPGGASEHSEEESEDVGAGERPEEEHPAD
ncbi:MAG TPA: YibE/F family protein [Acidimicrobiia bacterium]|nr:YibE/F family protein [Acidimicrobiia bacterium]